MEVAVTMDTLIFTAEIVWGSSVAIASLFIVGSAISSRIREQIVGLPTDRSMDDF